ncbi:MAG: pyrroline-5-carboxylate reductase [Proteobacteria bacterium]|nr:pyrroline-5-carboxylate reductase [Pseudomonadota bacterium]
MAGLDQRIGIIGAGNMAEAIVGALIESETVSASHIWVSDISRERLDMFQERFGIKTVSDNDKLFFECDIVILAVKPQIMKDVLSGLSEKIDPEMPDRKLVISIAAGVRLKKIELFLYGRLTGKSQKNMPVIRVMPNTPCLVLCGMSVMSANSNATAGDIDITRSILASMGKVIALDEKELDAVTAMSGSGPAYVFYFIESMIEAGLKLGFDQETASLLTIETFKGALSLLQSVNDSPEELRRKVTSPGGTTAAALNILEKNDVKKVFINAIRAARDRSIELSD